LKVLQGYTFASKNLKWDILRLLMPVGPICAMPYRWSQWDFMPDIITKIVKITLYLRKIGVIRQTGFILASHGGFGDFFSCKGSLLILHKAISAA
jgi:hypothetical protein